LVEEATLRAQAQRTGQELTYTCVPPGSGRRIALDRDSDGYFDRTELDAGTDPTDPGSIPDLPGSTVRVRTSSFELRGTVSDGAPGRVGFRSATRPDVRANRIVPPSRGGTSDPTIGGATLRVYNSAGSSQMATIALPSAGWSTKGPSGRPIYRFRAAIGPISKV